MLVKIIKLYVRFTLIYIKSHGLERLFLDVVKDQSYFNRFLQYYYSTDNTIDIFFAINSFLRPNKSFDRVKYLDKIIIWFIFSLLISFKDENQDNRLETARFLFFK